MATRKMAVMGILVDHRYRNAPEVQKVLTDHGEMIRCRTGVSQPEGDNGLITLSLEAETENVSALERDLAGIEGITVKSIIF